MTDDRHECNKLFCANCKQNRDAGHLCYMRLLKDVLPDASYKILYVFYDLETTKNKKYSDKATLHVPDLVCLQQFCSQCEDVEDWRVRAMRSEEALVLLGSCGGLLLRGWIQNFPDWCHHLHSSCVSAKHR